MAVTINIPSQVKTYANLAAFPASGSLKTIYIAEDTNKTYRWTGSVYVEISGADFSGYVPTSRTLTINGTTQDLSANRTFTIPTDLTIGTTPIASGTIGRVLFQGTGNVLQQSSSLFWDSTNNRLGIGTSTPSAGYSIDAVSGIKCAYIDTVDGISASSSTFSIWNLANNTGKLVFITQTSASQQTRMTIANNGNVLINTTTDAGFRLDVNGTARVQDNLLLTNGIIATSSGTTRLQSSLNFFSHQRLASSGAFGFDIRNSAATQCALWTYDAGSGNINFGGSTSAGALLLSTNNAERLRIFQTTGNVGINTTTDAGFRLDVNGTARVSGALTVSSGGAAITGQLQANGGLKATVVLNNTFNTNGNSLTIFQSSDALGEARFYQSVCAGFVTTINSSAILQAESTTKGFLPPRMTTTQRNAIASPAAGLIVYDTTLNLPHFFNGTIWVSL
jgi:hypothetical protein